MAIFSVDTLSLNRIVGNYDVEEYALRPCLFSENNLCSNFLLIFPFEGKSEEKKTGSKEIPLIFQNRATASRKAKIFIAWFACATRNWARLSSMIVGPAASGGPATHLKAEELNDSILKDWKIDPNAGVGQFEYVQRPNLKEFGRKAGEPFRIPSDFRELSRKLFNLKNNLRAKFLNACFSYQFALENWNAYPTVSILALVSSVESMVRDEITSQYCKDADKRCNLKKDIMKKFRSFFEYTLTNPLPPDLKKFLDNVYKKRSEYVHKTLLDGYGIRGIYYSESVSGKLEPTRELWMLERLVNAALIQWLIKI